jgi:hypothetical protein
MTRTLKIGLAYINIAYAFCYLVLGLIPSTRPTLLPYLLHLNVGPVENIFTLPNFLGGLILWNVIVGVSIWLVELLARYIK